MRQGRDQVVIDTPKVDVLVDGQGVGLVHRSALQASSTAGQTQSIREIVDQPIAAGRFVLRPMRLTDTGLIQHYAGDLRVARGTQNIPHPFPPGAAEAFVTRAMQHDRPGSVWVMDGSEQGLSEILGVISLKPMEVKAGRLGQSEVAYWVAPAFWNTGIASEAVRALIEVNPLADSTYFAEVFQDNPGSARVLTNAGFQYLGDAEAYCVARGAIVPTWTYTRKLNK